MIFQIATAADWERTPESGSCTTSAVGRTLEEEGFLHARGPLSPRAVVDVQPRGKTSS